MSDNLVGMWIGYYGSNKRYYGGEYEIIDQGIADPKRIKLNFPDGPAWKTINNSFGEPFHHSVTSDAEDKLFNPHANAISQIDNELKRLQDKIDELKIAKKVLQNL